jgi:hypothetical protein
LATLQDILSGNFPAAQRYAEGYAQMPSYLQDPYLGLSTSQVGNVTKGLLSKTQFEKAQEVASKNAETLLGLPKGNTAMDRAKAMGYDVNDILYHGTSSDVSNLIPSKGGEFGPGVYVSQNPNMANYFASRFGGESANIMPLVTNANDVLVTADKNIPRGLGYKGLTNKGYNSVLGIGSTGETQRTILNPENLRSVNAAFDPARANEPDLLAATLAIPVSGLLEQPKDKKKKK